MDNNQRQREINETNNIKTTDRFGHEVANLVLDVAQVLKVAALVQDCVLRQHPVERILHPNTIDTTQRSEQ